MVKETGKYETMFQKLFIQRRLRYVKSAGDENDKNRNLFE
jgi:hypothetical protein